MFPVVRAKLAPTIPFSFAGLHRDLSKLPNRLFPFLYRLLHDNEISLHRQSSVCETDLAALELKQEACQFGHFLQANPVEEWTVCSPPNLYFRD